MSIKSNKRVGRPVGTIDLNMDSVYRAALTVFADKGFDATTMTEIALAAGITRSSINYHFGNKMELWKKTIDYLTQRFIKDFEQTKKLNTDLDDISFMKVVIRQMVNFWAQEEGFSRLAMKELDQKNERSDYLIDHLMYPLVNLTKDVFGKLRKEGKIKKFDKQHQLSIILGMISYLFTNRYMFQKLHGIDVSNQEIVDQHTDAVIEIFFDGIRV